ncbi:related to Reverse transcriptase [Sporisorium reilianum SRZ2]|uniref:Related to Reverse transcriptase n=1 Tax=Sporisorium reilianum (strain SRZ2) TaxID=999809 RepID=E6ZXY0_SPORE|nr:related to Reverse transcriptase [Sporisorium reilianum SRZ2]
MSAADQLILHSIAPNRIDAVRERLVEADLAPIGVCETAIPGVPIEPAALLFTATPAAQSALAGVVAARDGLLLTWDQYEENITMHFGSVPVPLHRNAGADAASLNAAPTSATPHHEGAPHSEASTGGVPPSVTSEHMQVDHESQQKADDAPSRPPAYRTPVSITSGRSLAGPACALLGASASIHAPSVQLGFANTSALASREGLPRVPQRDPTTSDALPPPRRQAFLRDEVASLLALIPADEAPDSDPDDPEDEPLARQWQHRSSRRGAAPRGRGARTTAASSSTRGAAPPSRGGASRSRGASSSKGASKPTARANAERGSNATSGSKRPAVQDSATKRSRLVDPAPAPAASAGPQPATEDRVDLTSLLAMAISYVDGGWEPYPWLPRKTATVFTGEEADWCKRRVTTKVWGTRQRREWQELANEFSSHFQSYGASTIAELRSLTKREWLPFVTVALNARYNILCTSIAVQDSLHWYTSPPRLASVPDGADLKIIFTGFGGTMSPANRQRRIQAGSVRVDDLLLQDIPEWCGIPHEDRPRANKTKDLPGVVAWKAAAEAEVAKIVARVRAGRQTAPAALQPGPEDLAKAIPRARLADIPLTPEHDVSVRDRLADHYSGPRHLANLQWRAVEPASRTLTGRSLTVSSSNAPSWTEMGYTKASEVELTIHENILGERPAYGPPLSTVRITRIQHTPSADADGCYQTTITFASPVMLYAAWMTLPCWLPCLGLSQARHYPQPGEAKGPGSSPKLIRRLLIRAQETLNHCYVQKVLDAEVQGLKRVIVVEPANSNRLVTYKLTLDDPALVGTLSGKTRSTQGYLVKLEAGMYMPAGHLPLICRWCYRLEHDSDACGTRASTADDALCPIALAYRDFCWTLGERAGAVGCTKGLYAPVNASFLAEYLSIPAVPAAGASAPAAAAAGKPTESDTEMPSLAPSRPLWPPLPQANATRTRAPAAARMAEGIRVLQFNMGRAKDKLDQALTLLGDAHTPPDVLLLQEISQDISLPGFSFVGTPPYRAGNQMHLLAGIAYRSEWRAEVLRSNHFRAECRSIAVILSRPHSMQRFLFISSYMPVLDPQKHDATAYDCALDEVAGLIHAACRYDATLWGGDFNAVGSWSAPGTCETYLASHRHRAQALTTAAAELNVELHTPRGLLTMYSNNRGNAVHNTIDLTFSSGEVLGLRCLHWRYLDHQPITFRFFPPANVVDADTAAEPDYSLRLQRRWKRLDRVALSAALEASLAALDPASDADWEVTAATLFSTVNRLCGPIPRRRPPAAARHVPWWNEECAAAKDNLEAAAALATREYRSSRPETLDGLSRKARRRVLRRARWKDPICRQSRSALRKARRKARAVYLRKQIGDLLTAEQWGAFQTGTIDDTDSVRIVALYEALQRPDGTPARTWAEKATVFRHQFFPHSRDRPATQDRVMPPAEDVDLPEVTEWEIADALQATSVSGAPGSDGITADFLRLCWQQATFRRRFRASLTAVMRGRTLPPSWKTAVITIIPKPGKDNDMSLPKNYRPISLLSVAGKVFDRVLLCRLIHLSDSALSDVHHGCRPLRDPVIAVGQTLDCASMWRALNQHVAIFTIDVGSTFNSIDHDAMVQRVATLVGDAYARVILSWLADRSIRLKFDGNLADQHHAMGRRSVPQGSPLSPLLWVMYMDDFFQTRRVDALARCWTYVDDVTVAASGSTAAEAMSSLNRWMRIFERWTSTNALSLDKPALLLVGPAGATPAHGLAEGAVWTIGSFASTAAAEIRILGVHIDAEFTLAPHIQMLVDKSDRALAVLLRKARSLGSHLAPKQRKKIIQTIVWPMLDFGAWLVSGLDTRHVDLLSHLDRCMARFVFQLPFENRSGGCLALNGGASNRDSLALACCHSTLRLAAQRERRLCSPTILAGLSPCGTAPLRVPPARPSTPVVAIAPSKEEAVRQHDAILREHADATLVYTDGSRLDSGVGFGCYVTGLLTGQPHASSQGLNPLHNDIFEAELSAITAGLRACLPDAKGDAPPPSSLPPIYIFTDSASSLQRLNCPWSQDRRAGQRRCAIIRTIVHTLLRLGCPSVHFVWVPGHVGVAGNELADRLARRGAALQNQATDATANLGPVRARIREASQALRQTRWNKEPSRHLHEVSPNVGKSNAAIYEVRSLLPAQRLLLWPADERNGLFILSGGPLARSDEALAKRCAIDTFLRHAEDLVPQKRSAGSTPRRPTQTVAPASPAPAAADGTLHNDGTSDDASSTFSGWTSSSDGVDYDAIDDGDSDPDLHTDGL